MKAKTLLLFIFCCLALPTLSAQNTKNLSLKEAVQLALKNSEQAKLSENRIQISKNQLKTTKNNRYPDVKLSGQYLYLAHADVDLKIEQPGSEGSTGSTTENAQMPEVHQLLLGQASVGMPIFSGFKLKNSIKADEHAYKAQVFQTEFDKQNIGLGAIQYYIALYKTEQSCTLIQENLGSATQRVKDFTAKEKNGLLARNDLLKAALQKSTIELALAEAQKEKAMLNFQLVQYLNLPKNTQLNIQMPTEDFFPAIPEEQADSLFRSDIKALHNRVLSAKDRVNVTKGSYYPSISLSAGYIAMDLQNTLSVKNAMNIGVGFSYNISEIFKNKDQVALAKSKVQELHYLWEENMDQAAFEIEDARKEYELTVQKLKVYTKSQEQATENYRIVKDKYDNGLQDTNDLLEADVQKLKAKMELAMAKADIVLKYYELLQAKGILVEKILQ